MTKAYVTECIYSLFSSLDLTYENTTTFLDVTGNKYVGDDRMLDNGTKVSSRQCYCSDQDCVPSGALNISTCKYGAPVFLSMPHYYLADPSYTDAITGMNPDKEKHEFSLIVEPVSSFCKEAYCMSYYCNIRHLLIF